VLIAIGSSVTMADAEAMGVRRVSIGGSLYGAMMGWFEESVRQLVTEGRFDIGGSRVSGKRFAELFDQAGE